VARPKPNPVQRAMAAVLDLTTEERNSFEVNMRIVEERLHGAKQPPAPRRKATPKPKSAPEASNV
jgi:hypothetical protein